MEVELRKRGVTRDEVREYVQKGLGNAKQQRIAELRLQYSDIGTLRKTFVESLVGNERIYPTVLPTQVSGRWSYLNPPLSGFPKKCINPSCIKGHHSRSSSCWSLVDCFIPDEGTFWIEHDLDAVEHRIYCLLLQWKERLEELRNGVDIHTRVTCALFNLPLPSNLLNPHKAVEDTDWRGKVQWQGKDDTRRTMSKNFTYGQGQYCYVQRVKGDKARTPYRVYKKLRYTPTVVYLIPNIETYRILNPSTGVLERPDYEKLAIAFMEDNVEIQLRKADLMERCRVERISRTLYGSPRKAYFKNQETAKELFNFIIQGTVASYINESVILLQRRFPESYLIQNKHDALKWAFYYQSTTEEGKREEEAQILEECKKICQRKLSLGNEEILITATFHIIRAPQRD